MTGEALVIGFGNRWRGDDAAGLCVADRLRERLPDVTVLTCERVPADLFDVWGPTSRVFLVDAACSVLEPGAVHRFDAREAPLPCELLRVSTHTGGVAEAVELARALSSLPRELVVYGIEGGCFEPGAALSGPVSRAVDRVVERVLADLGRLACTRPA